MVLEAVKKTSYLTQPKKQQNWQNYEGDCLHSAESNRVTSGQEEWNKSPFLGSTEPKGKIF